MMGFLGKKKSLSVSLPSNSMVVTNSPPATLQKSTSLPVTQADIIAVKSIMRVSSLDESLHRRGLSKSSSTKSLNWHEIQIREYSRDVGDNPSCSSGTPISIGWKYSPKLKRFPVELYEESHPPRRSMEEMVLPRDVRFKMLTQEWDVPRSECASATREALKVKNSRRRTVHNLGRVSPKMEEAMESVGKKFKRTLSLKKEPKLDDLMQEADKVASSSLAVMAAKEYEWEPKQLLKGEESKKTLADYDAVDYESEEEPETEIPPKGITKSIVISEDDATTA